MCDGMDGCSGLLSSSLSLILCIPFFSSDGRTGAVCRWTQLLHFQVWTYAADGRTDATVGRITWSVDVLWACGGGGGGDDQKDQRTMKTLGRDIVGGSLSLSLSWSSLPLYGFVSSALLPTAILREYGGLARRYRSHLHSRRRPGLVYPEAI